MARDTAAIGTDVVIGENTPPVETTVEALIRAYNRQPLNSGLSTGDLVYWDATAGNWVRVAGTKSAGQLPVAQADGTVAWGNGSSSTRVRLSANTAGTATATVDPIEFDAETFDDGNWHDNVTNPSRVTVDQTGRYRVKGSIEYASNATGIRQARIHVNGVFRTYGIWPALGSGNTVAAVSDVFALTAGDYIELAAYQTSGSGLIIRGGDGLATFLIVERLS